MPNVFTDYAQTHWSRSTTTWSPCRPSTRPAGRETHVLSVADALAQFKVKYPFVDDAQAAELFARGG